jgi:magnesium chelatase family protein
LVARVRTVAFQGIEAIDVEAQVTITAGLPAFTVVGLPDKTVAESRERVRACLSALGLALPPRRITVNLAPADLLKEGSHFDLPIAMALLAAMGVLPADEVEGAVAMGELALDGSLLPVAGVLQAAVLSVRARPAARLPGPARSRCWRRHRCWRLSITSRAHNCGIR